MDIESLKKRINNIFIELGFKIEFVGEKQYKYWVYNNCYCKITYLEKLNAFVIESADNLTDAMNGVLEDGDLYYEDISEDAMLHQLRRDVVAYYMD